MHCGEALPILTDDLIWEILLRLPVRSLVQFKCVCKSWKTLISHPQFAKNHLQTSRADQQLVSNIWSGFLLKFSVQELFQNLSTPVERSSFAINGGYWVVGSCNGVLCLTGTSIDINDGDVILWNPSIRSIRFMSRTQLHVLPDLKVNGWGFGYDHLNDRFKMLLVRGKGENMTTILYTFGPDYWTVIPNFPCHSIDTTGKFLNGTLHWIVTKTKRKRGISYDQRVMVILSFDLGTEKYGEVLLPDEQDTHKFCIPVLDVLRNSLYVSFFHSEKVHVWLMKEYGVKDSWTKLMIIPQFTGHRMNFGNERFVQFFQLLGISEDGVLLFKTSFSTGLILYNSNDGRFDYHNCGQGLFRLSTYHESLVSPQML